MYNNRPKTHRYQGIIDDMIDQYNFDVKALNLSNQGLNIRLDDKTCSLITLTSKTLKLNKKKL